ncbi:MAG: sugar ABC transporter substrate-binding protein [Blautia sp.]
MRKRIYGIAIAAAMAMVFAGCGGKKETAGTQQTETVEDTGADTADASGEKEGEAGTVKIAQSMPTLNNPWYVLFANGSKDMADALGVELTQVTNPETNAWSPETQISKIENLIATEPDVIEIDPTSTDGINSAIDEARSRDIAVVMSGTKVSTEVDASIVGDNKQGGILCGQFMGKALEGKGKVAMLLGTPGRDVIQARESGFKEGLSEYTDVEIVAEQVANLERAEAVSVTETILQANPEIDAIWAANDEMALGAIEALRSLDKVGKVIVGGFDATPDAVTAIQNGEMHFSANQIPYEMGVRAIGISTLIAQGKDIPSDDIALELSLVTYENVKEYVENQDAEQKAVVEDVIKEYGLK